MRAVYPGRQPGTFAAAQGGGSEYEAADGSTCPTAAPSSTATRGSMASSGCSSPREFRNCAAATSPRLDPWPRGLGATPIYSPGRRAPLLTVVRSVADYTA